MAAAIDIAFFFPGGWLMDTRGRFVVAVPVVASTAVACLLLPLATTTATVAAVMVLIAAGNGLGSGIVMTLGADAAPTEGRAQFLGGWRLCGDIGVSGGPVLVSVLVAAVAAGHGLPSCWAHWPRRARCGSATGPAGWTGRAALSRR